MKRGGVSANIPSHKKYSQRGLACLPGLLALLCATLCGCKANKSARLTPAQVHAVTQELAKAAADSAPRGTVIRTRRARSSSGQTLPDELHIDLRGDDSTLNRLRQSVNVVATQRRLTVDPEIASGAVSRIVLRSAGVATHRIEINVLGPQSGGADRTPPGTARLAIVLDDLGSDRKAADSIFSLRVPITLSVLPYHEHSREIAQEARKHGCEVMLHLPMQSVANETPEQVELRPGLSQNEVEEIVGKMLEAVPEAVGVNNHQGSQATANAALMNELMPVLRDAGVFYVDSRTTAATVAYEIARENGVRTGSRNVPFLDDVREKAAIKRQLQIAIRGAKEKGEAIAIGHPHPETLEALREMLPEVKRQGVRLVLVSETVR